MAVISMLQGTCSYIVCCSESASLSLADQCSSIRAAFQQVRAPRNHASHHDVHIASVLMAIDLLHIQMASMRLWSVLDTYLVMPALQRHMQNCAAHRQRRTQNYRLCLTIKQKHIRQLLSMQTQANVGCKHGNSGWSAH